MPKLTLVRGVGCIVSPVALVTGEHEGCAARGVGSNPPRLPNCGEELKAKAPPSIWLCMFRQWG